MKCFKKCVTAPSTALDSRDQVRVGRETRYVLVDIVCGYLYYAVYYLYCEFSTLTFAVCPRNACRLVLIVSWSSGTLCLAAI